MGCFEIKFKFKEKTEIEKKDFSGDHFYKTCSHKQGVLHQITQKNTLLFDFKSFLKKFYTVKQLKILQSWAKKFDNQLNLNYLQYQV